MPESVNFDRIAEQFDQSRAYSPQASAEIAAAFARAGKLQHHHCALEIGAGTGRIALPLAPYVGKILGLDISKKMLDVFEQKRGQMAAYPIQGDAAYLPLPAASLDVIIVVHVLHLVGDPAGAVAELRRVLKPDGVILTGAIRSAESDQLHNLWRSLTKAIRKKRAKPAELLQAGGWHLHPAESQEIYLAQESTPATFLAQIEKRVWSTTWEFSAAEHAALVAALRAKLEARFDDFEKPAKTHALFQIKAYRAQAPNLG